MSKPHGRMKQRSSSTQPHTPRRNASLNKLPDHLDGARAWPARHGRPPRAANRRLSELGGVGRHPFERLGGLPLQLRARTSSPSSAQPISLTLSGSIPSNQSNSAVSNGAMPTAQVALVTRSGRRSGNGETVGSAAGAADQAETLNAEFVRDRGQASATQSTTWRPRLRSEPP